MAGMEFFIRPATGTTSSDWLRIADVDIKVSITRRITRTVTHGGEGDDLVDEGAESAVYIVDGEMEIDVYKKVLAYVSQWSTIHSRSFCRKGCQSSVQ